MEPANEVYYFEIAQGAWTGDFSFEITNFRAFFRDRLALKNRVLALVLHAAQKLGGASTIVSRIRGERQEGPAGTMHSRVWVRKAGLTLYTMQGRYVLDPDGRDVRVHLKERFGPIPFLFRNEKDATAEISDGGMRSTYHMPLLGAAWVGNYTVSSDRDHLQAVYESGWGRAVETIHREATGTA